MRFIEFRIRNEYLGPRRLPDLPDAMPVSVPMALMEDPVCGRGEENDRWLFGGTLCSAAWDNLEWRNGVFAFMHDEECCV